MSASRCGPSRRWRRRWARSAQGALPQSVPGLSIDTRTIAPGEAFFALKDARDGHDSSRRR